jgi:FeS assembly SUF system protein
MTTKEQVIDALKAIYDPEIPVNIYDLGLVYDVLVTNEKVKIIMTLTTATCPAAAFMPEQVRSAVMEACHVKDVEVEITFTPKWTKDRMSERARTELGF